MRLTLPPVPPPCSPAQQAAQQHADKCYAETNHLEACPECGDGTLPFACPKEIVYVFSLIAPECENDVKALA